MPISLSKPIKKSISTPAGLSANDKASSSSSSSSGNGLSVFKTLTLHENDSIVHVEGLSQDTINDFIEYDDGARMAFIENLMVSLYTTTGSNNNTDKASKVLKCVEIINICGFNSNENFFILNTLMKELNSSRNVEMNLLLLKSLLSKYSRGIEPFIIDLIPIIIPFHSDKSVAVRDLASILCKDISDSLSPYSFRLIYPHLCKGFTRDDWRDKVGSLNFLKCLSPKMAQQLSPLLPDLIPKVSECIYDSKKQVQVAGIESLVIACQCISNDDIRPLVPQLVNVIAYPDEATKILDLLLETTFVATVDASVLSLIAPLLGKVMRGRGTSAIKRKAARVIDIMCRLVQEPSDVAPFMPLLLPALDKLIDEVVDEEVCQVAKDARAILLQANGEGKASSNSNAQRICNILKVEQVHTYLHNALKTLKTNTSTFASTDASTTGSNVIEETIFKYVASILSYLIIYDTVAHNELVDSIGDHDKVTQLQAAMSPRSQWRSCTAPYLKTLLLKPIGNYYLQSEDDAVMMDSNVDKISTLYRTMVLGTTADIQAETDSDDSNLCNIEFSLAFGGKILLHNTFLKLGKSRRYGLMGKNGAGKTTLLTNIGSGNIEGLPPHLKMVYVQHDDASDDYGISILDESMKLKTLTDANVTIDEATAAFKKIGFTDLMLSSPRSALSGGWKMKLLIVRAMLSNADVLLLDEPTNHLDTASVQWLVDYIMSKEGLTCLIVSHDTGFLDKVLTDVIHYENKKLVYYHGNLTHFVTIHPEAKYYYELEGTTMSFKFPIPERLDGINSTTRSIMKLENTSYTYPGASSPTLKDINVRVCLGSRIAVLGANGAGKSTLIKLLVQETQPDPPVPDEYGNVAESSMWKHMNLRVAYVAQHSFHHVEQHLEDTPVQYFKWRFFGGVDKEEFSKPTMRETDEEVQEKKHGERKYGDVDEVMGRRKNGKTMEYECTFIGQNPKREPNKYITLEKMIEMGHAKLVQQCDTKIAAMSAGLDLRPLVTAEIQGHLNDFNLDAEFGTHGTIRRLSGGQKVKLVLAAAMWNRPHVIVLDEPTNYLDREALGALTQAIKDFHGGIVIISHNSEFTDAICNERWLVKDGHCYTQGGAEELTLKTSSIKRSHSAPELDGEKKEENYGNTNKSISSEVVLNPRTLEGLSKKETRKLEKLAQVAGLSLKDYVGKLTCKSPEWKWL